MRMAVRFSVRMAVRFSVRAFVRMAVRIPPLHSSADVSPYKSLTTMGIKVSAWPLSGRFRALAFRAVRTELDGGSRGDPG